MKLATRMWLLWWCRARRAARRRGVRSLVSLSPGAAVDRALLAQAAVESVSLFDGPGGRVHLHMATSPLIDSVRLFAPTGDLFGPDGQIVELSAARRCKEQPPEVLLLVCPDSRPGSTPTSVLMAFAVAVNRDGRGTARGLYTLRLAASLEQLDGSAAAFYRTTLSLAALFASCCLRCKRRRRVGCGPGSDCSAATSRRCAKDSSIRICLMIRTAMKLASCIGCSSRRRQSAAGGTCAAQERLLADAAHELRTLLGLMRTSVDLALRRERPKEELVAAMEEVRSEVVRLGALSAASRSICARTGRLGVGAGCCCSRSPPVAAIQSARAEAETRSVLIEVEGSPDVTTSGHEPALRGCRQLAKQRAQVSIPPGSSILDFL